MNLVDNALDHGGGDASSCGPSERAGASSCTSATRAPASRREFRERAFDRFSRADEARSGGGSGLGLSIVELVATAHGGAVGARTPRPAGRDVWISLPPAASLSRFRRPEQRAAL